MSISKRVWMMIAAAALGGVSAGCASEEGLDGDEPTIEDDGKYEAWNSANNPAFVDSTFSYTIADYPATGEAKNTPWAGDYWATASDSINVRWDGTGDSPAEKVAKAFNLPGFSKYITDNTGIYGHDRKACDESSECTDLKDGSSCVKPRGATGTKAGRCIPGWWGICHGWAPAALAEPAPVKPVTKNGVTFYPGDLHALASFAYQTQLPTKFLSERCNKEGANLGTDGNGRVRESECRDMNAGSVLVVLANMVGLRKVGVVEDRTYDWEVWNQPIRGYAITNAVNGKIPELTKAQAIAKLGLDLTFNPLFTDKQIKKGEKQEGSYSATVAGEVVFKMSGDNDVDLYVKKGSAPTSSENDCSSAAGGSAEECRILAAPGDKIYWLALGYAETSKASLQVGANTGGSNYVYNTAAKRFFYVELDIKWISEARPARTPSDADAHTKTDSYQAIIETDAAGKVIGGEWVGDSQKTHPDFMWWPTAEPRSNQGGLTYAMVKDLMQQAKADAGGGTTDPVATTVKLRDNYSLAKSLPFDDQSVTLGVPGGATVKITMTGTGNADLYVKLGRRPTTSSFTKKSVTSTSSETVTFTAPAAGGTYYVRTRGMTTTSVVTVVAEITPAR